MNNRELLGAAAKVAGAHRADWGMDCFWLDGMQWNPLTDDGDALRLAVKLRLPIRFGAVDGVFVGVRPGLSFDTLDPNVATRQAITRAAAAMVASEAVVLPNV